MFRDHPTRTADLTLKRASCAWSLRRRFRRWLRFGPPRLPWLPARRASVPCSCAPRRLRARHRPSREPLPRKPDVADWLWRCFRAMDRLISCRTYAFSICRLAHLPQRARSTFLRDRAGSNAVPVHPWNGAKGSSQRQVFRAGLAPHLVGLDFERNLLAFGEAREDRKSTRLNSSHSQISYAVFCLKKKKKQTLHHTAAKDDHIIQDLDAWKL